MADTESLYPLFICHSDAVKILLNLVILSAPKNHFLGSGTLIPKHTEPILKYNPDHQLETQSPADAIIKKTGNSFSKHSLPDT